MFLISPDSKRPYYQVVYFVDGKRTKISTKTADRKEAEKFLASFVPPPPKGNKEQPVKKVSIKLSIFLMNIKPILATLTQLSI